MAVVTKYVHCVVYTSQCKGGKGDTVLGVQCIKGRLLVVRTSFIKMSECVHYEKFKGRLGFSFTLRILA